MADLLPLCLGLHEVKFRGHEKNREGVDSGKIDSMPLTHRDEIGNDAVLEGEIIRSVFHQYSKVKTMRRSLP